MAIIIGIIGDILFVKQFYCTEIRIELRHLDPFCVSKHKFAYRRNCRKRTMQFSEVPLALGVTLTEEDRQVELSTRTIHGCCWVCLPLMSIYLSSRYVLGRLELRYERGSRAKSAIKLKVMGMK